MKSYIREFNYTKKSGEKSKRKVFVMRESADAFDGFDFKYLDANGKRAVRRLFKDHDVGTVLSNKPTQHSSELDPALMKAWRRFNKVNCQ